MGFFETPVTIYQTDWQLLFKVRGIGFDNSHHYDYQYDAKESIGLK